MKTIIFRTQLFKASETFIAEQAVALPNFEKLLMGRKLFGAPDPRLPFFCPDLSSVKAFRMIAMGDMREFKKPAIEYGADILHAHFSIDGLYACNLARLLRIPLITTLHGFDITTARGEFIRSGRPALVRYALNQHRLKKEGSAFICVSEFIRQQALLRGFPEQKLRKHYIGIDTQTFQPVSNATQAPSLLHVARLVEKKGTAYLIKAFAKVLKTVPDAELHIVGGGPLMSDLTQLSKELGLDNAVKFHGVQPHSFVRSMLTRSSALVLPSVTAANGDAEGLGMVLLEASATGIPSIGTRHGGIPEAIRENETGILVAERNVEELASAIQTLLRDDALRQRMGHAARRMVESDFDIRKQATALEDLYREAAL